MSYLQGYLFTRIPVRDGLVIEMEGRTEDVNVQMLNTLGAVMFNATFATKTIVPTRNFVPGLYVLRLEIGDVRAYRKIIIE